MTATVPISRRHPLAWMAQQAPYMPVASVGLLAAVQRRDANATLHWSAPDDPYLAPELTLTARLELDGDIDPRLR